MKCPFCNNENDKVIDSRHTEDGYEIRRRRECMSCQKRYTTYEKIETISIMVTKKDNSSQPFDRNKILKGLLRACEKRSIPPKKIEATLNEIDSALQNTFKNTISSIEIGEMVMDKLKSLDEVAYIRFVSVYRDFKDINSFLQELITLQKSTSN